MVSVASVSASQSHWPRDAKSIALLLAIAVHVLLFWLLLKMRPLPLHDDHSAMQWVEIHSAARPEPLPLPAAVAERPAKPAPQPHRSVQQPSSAAPAHTVNEGQLYAGTATASSAAASDNSHSLRATTGFLFRPPRVLHRARAEYPREAFVAHEEGETEVLVTIAADGALTDAQIGTSSGSAALDAAALDAVRHYVFAAAQKDDAPVLAQALISISWRITPAIVSHFRVEFPSDSREHDVVGKKEWLKLQSSGH